MEAIRSLFNYYQRRSEGLPMTNIREELETRIAPLDLPYALDPLRNTDLKRVTIKLANVMAEFPLTLSEDPFAEASDWPVVVDHYQQFGSTSLPTMRVLFVVLQNISGIDPSKYISPEKIFPDKATQIKNLTNYLYDPSHDFPRDGVEELLSKTCKAARADGTLPDNLNPVLNPDLFPLTKDWKDELFQWQIESTTSPIIP